MEAAEAPVAVCLAALELHGTRDGGYGTLEAKCQLSARNFLDLDLTVQYVDEIWYDSFA